MLLQRTPRPDQTVRPLHKDAQVVLGCRKGHGDLENVLAVCIVTNSHLYILWPRLLSLLLPLLPTISRSLPTLFSTACVFPTVLGGFCVIGSVRHCGSDRCAAFNFCSLCKKSVNCKIIIRSNWMYVSVYRKSDCRLDD